MHPEGNRKNRGDPTTSTFVTFKGLSSHRNQDIWASAPAGTVADSPSVLCSENLTGSGANWQGRDQGEAAAAPSTTMLGGRAAQRRTCVQNQRDGASASSRPCSPVTGEQDPSSCSFIAMRERLLHSRHCIRSRRRHSVLSELTV